MWRARLRSAIVVFVALTSSSSLFRWFRLFAFASATGALAGLASAAFRWSLDRAAGVWAGRPWLIWALPFAGAAVAWCYAKWGGRASQGMDLVVSEARRPQNHLPLRMAPFVWLGTLATHVCGGSAGREGTAVQISAALADRFARHGLVDRRDRRATLVAGVAAGFGSVFGVPWTGAIFAWEACEVGTRGLRTAGGAVLASWVAHETAIWAGARHATYLAGVPPAWSAGNFLGLAAAGLAFGLAARGFVYAIEVVRGALRRATARAEARAAVGGLALAALASAFHIERSLGLGLEPMAQAFVSRAPWSDFAWKIVATGWTVGAGFKGGEATPLFFVGSTLGSALGPALGWPSPALAAVGLAAVFAGATRTPIASAALAIELFGWPFAGSALMACWLATAAAGGRGLYAAEADG